MTCFNQQNVHIAKSSDCFVEESKIVDSFFLMRQAGPCPNF